MTPNQKMQKIPLKAVVAIFEAARRIRYENSSRWSKREKLVALSERAFDLVKHMTPCGTGCSHCCHMAVAIVDTEAQIIAAHINKAAIRQPKRANPIIAMKHHNTMMQTFTEKPCSFLEEGRCSIYEVRPIACRGHHSLAESPDSCDLNRRPQVSTPSMNLKELEVAYAFSFVNEAWGDIREYFPTGRK